MILPVAILAGGLATRLRPITEEIPKSLVIVAGKPFIEWQLMYLASQGIKRVVICVGHLGEKIIAAIGNGNQFGLEVCYSFDGKMLLGTGGAIRQALSLLGDKFFVLYGDSYLPIRFSEVQKAFKASGKKGLMTVLRNNHRWDKSNVEFERGNIIQYNKTEIQPKMNYIDYGLGLFEWSSFQAYSVEKSFDLSKVYNDLLLVGELAGHEIFERFYEIGSRQGIEDTQCYLMRNIEKGIL